MNRPAVLKRSLACLLVAATLFALISLISYNAHDMERMGTPDAATKNWCGIWGARLADQLMLRLGYGSYVLVLIIALGGVIVVLRKSIEDLWMKLAGLMLLLASATTALGRIPGYPQNAVAGPGGNVGFFFTEFLGDTVGNFGTAIIIVAAAAFGLIFLGVDGVVVKAAAFAIHALSRAFVWLRRLVSGRRVAVSGPVEVIGKYKTAAVNAKAGAPEVTASLPLTPPEAKAAGAKTDDAGNERQDDASRQAEAKRKIEQRLSESIKKATQPDKLPKTLFDARQSGDGYQLPPLDILDDPEYQDVSQTQQQIETNIAILETTLADFNIGAEVVDIDRGPVVTRYELALAPGIKLTRLVSLADDIAIAVKAQSVRIVAPIPNKSTVGVEIPNKVRETVRLKEIIVSKEYKQGKWVLPVLLGKDTSGAPCIADLSKMPHLLIAGATGSGKSVCINAILASLLMTRRPEDMQMILVDPKMVELSMYQDIPHLLCPVVTDMKRAPWILEWAVKQMDERYDLLSSVGVRHIAQYNALGEEEIRERLGSDLEYEKVSFHLPYVVIIIDELADLMMSSAKEVESSITRLAQKSRAVGIHILLATQRPSVDVITGLIKANMPTRISFQVTSKVDSRTILDRNGAEKLLGSGDQLFLPPGTSDLLRLQGTYISDAEIKRIVTFVKQNKKAGDRYKLDMDNWGGDVDNEERPDDELYEQACRIVLESQRGSVSLLQRKLEIGYTRASRLVDFMARDGIVGSYKGSKAREVLMTLEEWEAGARTEGYGAASQPDAPF